MMFDSVIRFFVPDMQNLSGNLKYFVLLSLKHAKFSGPCNIFLWRGKVLPRNNGFVKLLKSVRGRIILISILLVAIFLILYTVAVVLVANSYLLTNTSQGINFSLSLLSGRIEENMTNVSTLAARFSVDTELKTYLNGMQDNWFNYYQQASSGVQSNPSYPVIKHFIIADSGCASFMHFGQTVASDRILTQQLLLKELSHFEKDRRMSPVFISEFSYVPE